jgi:predicted ATPase
MIYLSKITRKPGLRLGAGFPFNLALVKKLRSLSFDAPVTFFIGENGSGKSTVLESLAAAMKLPTLGSQDIARDESLAAARRLAGVWRLAQVKKPRAGFFFRAEDYFGYMRRLGGEMRELRRGEEEFEGKFKGYAKTLAVGSLCGQRGALESRYGPDPDARSHGEGFWHLLQARLRPGGLYLMDEPETPLSPLRQLALLSLLQAMAAKDCQFIIATHSPILMALPGASLLNFNTVPPEEIAYDDAEQVSLTRAFLRDPGAFLRKL